MTLDNLVNIQGRLAETYSQLDPNTIQHSAQIMNDRRTDKDLRNKWFWTADFSMYKVEDDEAVIYIAGRENNLIFNNIDEATNQLRRNDNYVLEPGEIATVVASVESGETLRVKHSDLNLEKYDHEFSYFEIDTDNFDKTLNQEQRAVAERFYGQGNDFEKNMEMLNESGISKTKVYVLNSDYVKNHIEEDGAVARACGLGSFGFGSSVIAGGRCVVNPGGSLRGVLLEVGEADDVKNLVSLQEDKLHDLLGKYVAPATLNQAKKEIAEFYQ